jgi:glycosyltransferase involved in cell wall biosynthesis/peptidoglycan/xylan/chitin deacetylase (PgdA/CDA1 family)
MSARFSIVIPTYQRRDLVVKTVTALERQEMTDFEVIVVIDGSTDGTGEALRRLEVAFPMTVIEQPNMGRAAAVNAGARAARGEVLLFLDDDMEAHPRLLGEHEVALREGAQVVFGHLALHNESPPNLMSDGIERWARSRLARLSAPGARFAMDDYVTGQMSVSADVFRAVGGFDVSFTRNGLFGGEDLDFGYRLARTGYRIVFKPEAISYQRYVVDPEEVLRRGKESGRSQQELVLKHPEWAAELGRDLRYKSLKSRLVGGALSLAPTIALRPLRAVAVALVRAGRRGYVTRRLFAALFIAEFRRGARQVRRSRTADRMYVLAYHAVCDLGGDQVLAPYGVPADRLAAQVDHLLASGYTFIDLETMLRALADGGRFPHKAVLLTFDDAYADVYDAAQAILEPRAIPSVVFAVSSEVGGTNSWDRDIGASTRQLLTAEQLRALQTQDVDVGSHTVTHRSLVSLPDRDLHNELIRSADELAALGLPRPVSLAYPYGLWNQTVAEAARDAGYEVAFTVQPGAVFAEASRYALPRIEVLARDSPRALRFALLTAAWPAWARRPVTWVQRASRRVRQA